MMLGRVLPPHPPARHAGRHTNFVQEPSARRAQRTCAGDPPWIRPSLARWTDAPGTALRKVGTRYSQPPDGDESGHKKWLVCDAGLSPRQREGVEKDLNLNLNLNLISRASIAARRILIGPLYGELWLGSSNPGWDKLLEQY